MIFRVSKVIFKVKMSYIASVDGTLVIDVIGQLSHDIIGRWGLMVIGYEDCKCNKCV